MTKKIEKQKQTLHNNDDEAITLEPLLSTTVEPSDDLRSSSHAPSIITCNKTKKRTLILISAGVLVLLTLHIYFVFRLKRTTFALQQLTIPDLCHVQSQGEVIVRYDNPSYCTPEIGPFAITFSKHATPFLQLALPRFNLQTGKSTVVSNIVFQMLSTPEVLHRLVFADDTGFEVFGYVPIRIWCMLVPFTINLNLRHLFHETTQPKSTLKPHHQYEWTNHNGLTAPSDVVNDIKDELEQLVTQILKTIVLSHIHVEQDDREVFAFTDVSFQYVSSVLWNVPALSIRVDADSTKEQIVRAGFTRFLLGGGNTFISAYSEISKNETGPLEAMMQTFLTGNDVAVHVKGDNRKDNPCYSLAVLNLMDYNVTIPAKIDGKPALLRHYAVRPTLKELNSKKRRCLLKIEVLITINNPLPIHFDLFSVECDLFYMEVHGSSKPSNSTFLQHIHDTKHIAWTTHEENNITLATTVREFETCKSVIGLYLHDQLAFEIQHGTIAVGAGPGNMSIPFSVKQIRIHPNLDASEAEALVDEERI